MKKNFKKRTAFISALVLAVSCLGTTAFAFDSDYKLAETYTSVVNSTITSADQVDWYKFTVTSADLPSVCSITLQIPDSCVYNFDLRYSASSSARPSVVSNETYVGGKRQRMMSKILNDAGTYYVRVYSQNGTKSSLDDYKLSISYNNSSTHTFALTKIGTKVELPDWASCADLLGNYTFKRTFYSATTGRTYENACAFLDTEYTSEKTSDYDSTFKATPEQTAIGANYIYSGDLMTNSKFKVVNDKIYTIEELMYYLHELDEPIIFYLNYEPMDEYQFWKKYVILNSVNIANNTISYYFPSDDNFITVDYDEFIVDGIDYSGIKSTFKGTSIVNSNEARRFQQIFD